MWLCYLFKMFKLTMVFLWCDLSSISPSVSLVSNLASESWASGLGKVGGRRACWHSDSTRPRPSFQAVNPFPKRPLPLPEGFPHIKQLWLRQKLCRLSPGRALNLSAQAQDSLSQVHAPAPHSAGFRPANPEGEAMCLDPHWAIHAHLFPIKQL